MVKRLVGSGPYFWIEEPYTEMEARRYADAAARHARRMIKDDPSWKNDEDMQRKLAEAPKPPISRQERAQMREQYPERYALTAAEARRVVRPSGELEFYRELYGPDGMNHTTIIRGRPR